MTLLEVRQVSRKTPLDGKLEISASAAATLAALGAELAVVAGGGEGPARLESMECRCARGAGEGHVHHFIASPLFTSLAPGSEVRVELADDRPLLRVAPA